MSATTAAAPSMAKKPPSSPINADLGANIASWPTKCALNRAVSMPMFRRRKTTKKISTDQPARKPWLPKKTQRRPR